MSFAPDDLDHDAFGPLDEWRRPEAIREREERQEEARRARPRETRFGRVDFGELRLRKPKAPDFVVDDWMVAKEVSFFAGESEAGKTFLAIDVMMRIALGWPVFGRRTKQGLVIYQIGESGDSLLDLRIPAWVHHFGADLPERVPFVVLPAKINLWTTDDRAKDGVEEVLAAIRGIQADYPDLPLSAFCVDTWSKAFIGGNENDGKDVARVIVNSETIARETGAHVPIIHHFPKGGATLRGHGSLKADVNAVAMLRCDTQTKIRTVSFDSALGGKLKDGEKTNFQFELLQVRLGEREDGKPITSCVVLPVGEKERARAEVENSVRLSTIEMAMFQALWKALAEFGGPPPPALDCSPNAKVVAYDEVKRLYVEASPDDEVEPGSDDQAREDARRRHLDRLRKQMKAAALKMASTWKVLSIGKCPHPDTGKETYFAWWTGRPVRGMPATYPPKTKQDETPAALSEGGDWIKDIL